MEGSHTRPSGTDSASSTQQPGESHRGGRHAPLGLGRLLDAPSRQVTGAAVVIAAAFLVLVAHSQWQSYENAVARAERDTRNAAFLLAEHAERTFDGIEFTLHAVERLRRDVELGIYRSQASVYINLNTLLSGSPVLREIGWFDVYGERQATSAGMNLPRISIAQEELFLGARGTKGHNLYISTPQRIPAQGVWQIGVSHRFETDGSFSGTSVGMVDVGEFIKIYRNLDLGPGGSATLLRNDGVVLAHVPEEQAPVSQSIATAELMQRHFPNARDGTYHGRDPFGTGTVQIASYASVQGHGEGLLVHVAMPRKLVLAEFWQGFGLQALVGGGLLTILLVGTRLIVGGLKRREQLQAQLAVALQAADAAGQAKSEFLAAMSHELRTPLNAVIGFSEMLTNEIFGPLGNARYHDYAQTIVDSGTHLLGLINDVLDLSKLDAGRLELQDEALDVEEVAANCLRMMEAQASKAKVTLELAVSHDLPRLRADHRRVRQVLLNLLSNAAKFTPEGGHVRLEAFCRDGALVLQVTDTGIGMAPEDLPKATEYFGQIDSRLGRRYSGTGLGLPLSQGLVELHGGSLAITSVLSEGTTVTVTFPPGRVLDSGQSAAQQALAKAVRAG